jgi:hypothetical protein
MFIVIMYVLWKIIKMFIPNFPIPFKRIFLRLPPLYQLDKSGVFGLIDGLVKVFVSNDTLGRRFARAGNSLSNFFIKSSGFIFGTLKSSGMTPPIPTGGKSNELLDRKTSFNPKEEAQANDEMVQCIEEKTLPIFPEMSSFEKSKTMLRNSQSATTCKIKSLSALSNILSTRI